MNEQSFFLVMPVRDMADSVADDIRAFLEQSAAEMELAKRETKGHHPATDGGDEDE